MSTESIKKGLVSSLLQKMVRKEKEFKTYSRNAQNRANEEEGRMQSRYSTFKEEGQYLAGGLASKHKDIVESINAIKKILDSVKFRASAVAELYSIVQVEFDDESQNEFFLFPILGGEDIEGVKVVSPYSPIGRALLGKKERESFLYSVGRKQRTGEIINVR